MGWKDRFTFREKHAVEHDVCGSTLRFYPNRIGMLQDLSEISRPIATALAALFAERESGMVEKVSSQGDTVIRESTYLAPSVEAVAHREQSRDAAIRSLIDAVADPRLRLTLGRLLMDSLREEFPYHSDRPAPEVEEFLYGDKGSYSGLDLPAMSAMILGWVKANARQFGKVGEQIAGEIAGRLAGAGLSPDRPIESPSTMPSPEPGSTSKTPSSPPSPVAST